MSDPEQENFKISIEEYLFFRKNFFEDENNKFKFQRFGQAFCNHYNLTCPELFYEESQEKADDYILKNMVE